MKFSIWYYACKFGAVLFLVAALGFFAGKDNEILGLFVAVALVALICLGLIGAILGILWTFGKLRMKCPFCNMYGEVGGSKEDGLWMDCRKCGFIHGSGPFRLKIIKEKPTDEPET